MVLWSLLFLLGNSLLHACARLPENLYGYLGLAAAVILIFTLNQAHNLPIRRLLPALRCLIPMLLGWSLALLHASWQLAKTLPVELEGKSLTVQGTVISVPESRDHSLSFEFLVKNAPLTERKLKLSWYGQPLPLMQAGEQWQLQVKLKRPHSVLNPGGFDYERWLFEHGVHAQGYVVPRANNTRLSNLTSWRQHIEQWRQFLNQGIQTALAGRAGQGLIAALVVGMRDRIMPAQWSTMQATGTNHLMAIAGLHIGFVSGFMYAAASWLWRRSARLPLLLPAPQVAALSALLAAVIYSALAGFAIPTQRAIIMLAVFLLSTFLKRNLPPWQAWAIALWLMLLLDPAASLSDSFWLSFGSVAIILFGVTGRLKATGFGWKHFRAQWVVSLALIPLTLYFFHLLSLTGFIANAIAIPWVGFIVLPLALSGAASYLIYPAVGCWLWQWAEKLLMLMWRVLDWLASLTGLQYQGYVSSSWALFAAIIGFLLLIAPRGLPGRWLGFIWILPLFDQSVAAPARQELWFTVLDVGQGLATVIRTAHHTLVYDAGPKYSADYDMGKAVVVPFLKAQHVEQVDMLTVSHADNDHRGGVESILKALKVTAVFSSFENKFTIKHKFLCRRGMRWHWDGADFEYINELTEQKRNDNCCVLKITFGRNSILLPGDIEKRAERQLLAKDKDKLAATIVVVPHHGSATSSTAAFVESVHPRYAVFAVGYRNRFHFPKPAVVGRYQALQTTLYRTDVSGAVTFKMHYNQDAIEVIEYRKRIGHFWN